MECIMERVSKWIGVLRDILIENSKPSDRKIIGKQVIDLSHHNGQVDFKKVKNSGIFGVIQRLGYGDENIDRTAQSNIPQAYSQGLKIGAYWFMYALSMEEAIKEADFFNSQLAIYKDKICLPVFADYEYDSEEYAKKQGVKLDKKLRTDIVIAFLERLKAYGWEVGVYANRDYLIYKFDYSRIEKYILWYADWRKNPDQKFIDRAMLWQYTSKGEVDGVKGEVDISELK